MGEQIVGRGSAVWIRLETAQDKCFSFSGHRVRNLWMDFKHPNLDKIHQHNPKNAFSKLWTKLNTIYQCRISVFSVWV